MIQDKQYAGDCWIGARTYQEDAVAFCDLGNPSDSGLENCVVVVADGMGGHAAGDVASSTVVRAFVNDIRAQEGDGTERLMHALNASNAALAAIKEEREDLKDMGCTMVAALVTAQGLSWISVGDSPLYLLRDRRLRRLNKDHSLGALLDAQADAGDISAEEARSSRQRNALLSAVTGEPLKQVDFQSEPLALEPGDRILVATDGLNSLPEDDTERILGNPHHTTAKAIVESLLDAVRREGVPKQDNTTVAVVLTDAKAPSSALTTRRPAFYFSLMLAAVALIAAGAFVMNSWPPAETPAETSAEADQPPAETESNRVPEAGAKAIGTKAIEEETTREKVPDTDDKK